MPFSHSDLSPYNSHIIAALPAVPGDPEIEALVMLQHAMEVIAEVVEQPRSTTGNARVPGILSSTELVGPWQSPNGMHSVACIYVEDRPVTWQPASADKDKLHHLLVMTADKNGLLLITATDAEHRAAILARLHLNYFGPWNLIPQAVLVKALIENRELKTLWLAGIHRDTSVKPSSKILAGSDLRDAIDPMNDSSYLAGAVRSTAGGVSLRNSSVWIGPNASIQAFETRAEGLLATIWAAIQAAPEPDLQVHSSLARWADKMDDANQCYFVDHVDPETIDSTGKGKAQTLVDRFMVELDPSGPAIGSPAWAFKVRVTERATHDVEIVEVVPELVDGRVAFHFDAPPTAPFDAWTNAIKASPALLRVYYDSGHTVASGALSLVRIQDLPFAGFEYADFKLYDVTKEKPQDDTSGMLLPLQNMMEDVDNSLFKWTFKEGLPRLRLSLPAQGACWLFCDDGSSEVADFVHLDIQATPKRLTLIHAKGASSDSSERQCAPGPYEVVSAQAIKNLRALSAQELATRIKRRLEKNGTERVWDQPWQAGGQPMIDVAPFRMALENLGTNYACAVVIVQPHVLQSKHELPGSQRRQTVGARQLRTLLSGVESLARSMSARFTVITDSR